MRDESGKKLVVKLHYKWKKIRSVTNIVITCRTVARIHYRMPDMLSGTFQRESSKREKIANSITMSKLRQSDFIQGVCAVGIDAVGHMFSQWSTDR